MLKHTEAIIAGLDAAYAGAQKTDTPLIRKMATWGVRSAAIEIAGQLNVTQGGAELLAWIKSHPTEPS